MSWLKMAFEKKKIGVDICFKKLTNDELEINIYNKLLSKHHKSESIYQFLLRGNVIFF